MEPADFDGLDLPPLTVEAMMNLFPTQCSDPEVVQALSNDGALAEFMSEDNVAKRGEIFDAATFNYLNRVPAGDPRRLVDDANGTTDDELSKLCVYEFVDEQDERPQSAPHNVKRQRMTRSPGLRRKSTNVNADTLQKMMYKGTTVMVSRELDDQKTVVFFPDGYTKEKDPIEPGITSVDKSELKPWVRCDKKLPGFPNAVCLECAGHSNLRPCFFCELPDDEDNKEETPIEVRDEGFSLKTCLDEFYALKPRKQHRIMCNVLKPMVFENVYKNIIELQFNSKFWKNYTAMCLSRERILRNDPSFNTLTNNCDFAAFFYRFMDRKCYRPQSPIKEVDKALMKDEKNGVNINGEFKAFMNAMHSLLLEGKINAIIRHWENSFFSDNDETVSGGAVSSGASAGVSASMFASSLPMPDGEAYV